MQLYRYLYVLTNLAVHSFNALVQRLITQSLLHEPFSWKYTIFRSSLMGNLIHINMSFYCFLNIFFYFTSPVYVPLRRPQWQHSLSELHTTRKVYSHVYAAPYFMLRDRLELREHRYITAHAAVLRLWKAGLQLGPPPPARVAPRW